MLEDDVPLAGTMSLSLTVHKAQPQKQLAEGKSECLKGSSDKWTAQQDSTCAQGSLQQPSPTWQRRPSRDLQGAGGRRCELEGSTWEVGSSDGAVPGPMGLSVVIRLGCPRKVRVIVVGTFKPDAWLEI